MDLDKDDLLRNLLPGFLFIIVIATFHYFVQPIRLLENENISSIITVVAAYPIGFLIQITYRTLFHTNGIGVKYSEQTAMEIYECELIENSLACKVIEKQGQNIRDDVRKAKLISQFLTFSLTHSSNKGFNERINFLMSYFHALGSSLGAIGSAIVLIVIGLSWGWVHDWRDLQMYIDEKLFWSFLGWVIVWGVMALVIWQARKKTKASQQDAMRVFINSHQFMGYVQKYLGNESENVLGTAKTS